MGFYGTLWNLFSEGSGDMWVETVVDGKQAGGKRIIVPGAGENNVKMPRQAGVTNNQEGQQVFLERVNRTPRLVVCGGGHVSVPIIQMGKMLGFYVTALEDRPKFADCERRAGADEVICLPFAEGLDEIEGDRDCWFVVVTRGHRYDTLCLEKILKKSFAYVGMMGSKRRTTLVKDQLEEKGFARSLVDTVHTPIGLEIGAETPEEIAVSVMAQIIQVKNTGTRGEGYSKELLEALADQGGRKKVLATIISRKGSAPRSVGTKMLVYEDGTAIGTIGGG